MNELSLVTGGAGFIGSHLVDGLVDQGRPVRVLDDFSTGLRDNLAHHPNLQIVEGSLTDPKSIAKAMRDVRVVYHLGALASVARSVENPVATHEACATGTLNILNEARKVGVRRVVYAASSSAYGGSSSAAGQTEDQQVATLSPYAAAKMAGELYMQAFAKTYGIETVRLRFFNIFGPRQRSDSPYSGVIALFTAAMCRGEIPTVHGDGLQSRDFTYVTNAVQALMKGAEAPDASGNVYNVGTGSSITVLDLIAALNDLLGTDLTPQHVETRAGDVKFSKADIRRAKLELGYQPSVTFAQGLAKTLAWYRETLMFDAPTKKLQFA